MGSRALFYLDAHWRNDLPLVEELNIILQSEIDAVVMIDDFKVPFDAGYGYDDYGLGKSLRLEILAYLASMNVRIFFPRLAAAEETGAVRGVCVLSGSLAAELSTCTSLRSNDWRDWKLEEMEHERNGTAQGSATGAVTLSAGENMEELTQMSDLTQRLDDVIGTIAERHVSDLKRQLDELIGTIVRE